MEERNKLPAHLGGHLGITHVDAGALNYFISGQKITSMIDIGCGPGGMLVLGESLKLNCLGVDGDYTLPPKRNVMVVDFTKGKFIPSDKYDLAWSVEFVEHVEEKYIDNYMPCFSSAKMVCMTHAVKGAGGHHHVNSQNKEYWIRVFETYNFSFNQSMTEEVRKKSNMKRNFMRDNGLVFIKSTI